jgi:hypothetical protein
MKARLLACSLAGVIGLTIGGSAWSGCGCLKTTCALKPVCSTVHVVEVKKPTCGCKGGLLDFNGWLY